jgi:hypothetical protein
MLFTPQNVYETRFFAVIYCPTSVFLAMFSLPLDKSIAPPPFTSSLYLIVDMQLFPIV